MNRSQMALESPRTNRGVSHPHQTLPARPTPRRSSAVGRYEVPELALDVDKTLFGLLRPETCDGADYIKADCSLGRRRVRLLLRLPAGGLADLGARIRAMEIARALEAKP
jgi:hypothetical protein